jgi:hypothetical protein
LVEVVVSPDTPGLEVVKAAAGGTSSMVTVVVALCVLTLFDAVTVAVNVPTSA